MADLNNLLDELNNDDGNDYDADADNNDQDQPNNNDDEYEEEARGVRIMERAGVPAALAAVTAARRRRPTEDDNDIDADERYYQTYSSTRGARSSARYGADDFNTDHTPGDDGVDDGDILDEDDYDERNYNPDYDQLKALWTSELACPELLPHDTETILKNMDDLNEKEELVEVLHQRSRMHSAAGGGGGPSSRGEQQRVSGELASLVAQITKMDLDRTRFMLVDLARTRMAKIENHALHNRTLVNRMTEEEVRERIIIPYDFTSEIRWHVASANLDMNCAVFISRIF